MNHAEIVEFCLSRLKERGFESYECIYNSTIHEELLNENNRPSHLGTKVNELLTLNGIIDQKKASLKLSTITKASIRQTIDDLYELALNSEPDPHVSVSYIGTKQSFSSGSLQVDKKVMVDKNSELLNEINRAYPNTHITLLLNHYLHSNTYANSNKCFLYSENGYYNMSFNFHSKDGDEMSSMNYEIYDMNKLPENLIDCANFKSILAESEEQIITQNLPETFVGDVIIAPSCFYFWEYLTNQLSGTSIISGVSPFVNAIGTQITSPLFTMRSRPESDNLVSKSSFSGEGFPLKDCTIVSNGVLQSHLLSNYASRVLQRDHQNKSAINICIEPGNESLKAIIEATDRGILLNRYAGSGSMNESGFSGIAKNSYYIEDGKIKYPLKETMISGDILDLLINIKAISKEKINFGNKESPWVCCSGVRIT